MSKVAANLRFNCDMTNGDFLGAFGAVTEQSHFQPQLLDHVDN